MDHSTKTNYTIVKVIAGVVLALLIIIPIAKLLFFPTEEETTEIQAEDIQTPQAMEGADYNTLINMGLDYYNRGNYGAALAFWEQALQKQPNDALALNNIASSLIQLGRYDEAIMMLEQAIADDPQNQLFRNNLKWAQDEKAKQ